MKHFLYCVTIGILLGMSLMEVVFPLALSYLIMLFTLPFFVSAYYKRIDDTLTMFMILISIFFMATVIILFCSLPQSVFLVIASIMAFDGIASNNSWKF